MFVYYSLLTWNTRSLQIDDDEGRTVFQPLISHRFIFFLRKKEGSLSMKLAIPLEQNPTLCEHRSRNLLMMTQRTASGICWNNHSHRSNIKNNKGMTMMAVEKIDIPYPKNTSFEILGTWFSSNSLWWIYRQSKQQHENEEPERKRGTSSQCVWFN